MDTPRHRVLLVDDDDAIRTHLTPFLERSGFAVTAAADGAEALAVLESAPTDLVVLDVVMPVIDGREVLRRIRSAGRWTPVILLTAVGESFERAAALEEGADDYLNKPFDPQELVARIRAVLRRAGGGQPPLGAAQQLSSGALRVNRIARRTWVDDNEVLLTPKAFALLEYLITHPDEVISRERLLATVWGYDFPVTSRAVDHRIAELRRVLGDDAAQPRWIETIAGVGYRFTRDVTRA